MAERTLLLRRSSLGDVVLLGAVTAALPGEVVVSTEQRWMGVARRLRGVDRVISWGDVGELTRLGATGARVIDLQGSARSRRLRLAFGGGEVWSKGTAERLRWLARLGAGRGSVVQRYGRACGVRPVPPPWIDLGATGQGLALIPGAAWAAKRWSAQGFIGVGRGWGGPVVVLGSVEERELIEKISTAIPGARAVAERGFEATLKSLADCSVAVGGDTGLTHLAAACGLATVTIMGPTHPGDGFVERGRVVSKRLWCRPCAVHGRSGCPLGHHRCLSSIEVDEVLAAARAEAGR